MMQRILCGCSITAFSFNMIRHQMKNVLALQNCRNITTSTSDQIGHSSIMKSNTKENDGLHDADSRIKENEHEANATAPKSSVWSQFSSNKYEKFADSSTHIIYDFDEEQQRLEEGLEIYKKEKIKEKIQLERGLTGVFDAEELVDLLREHNAKDIAVIRVPDHMKYVDYMVIASCKSQRHLNSLAQLVRRIYKNKKHSSDRYCLLEGKNTGWIAIDMGNIALHLMDPEMREDYDLETLWTVGAEYDDKCQAYVDPLDPLSYDVKQNDVSLEMQKVDTT